MVDKLRSLWYYAYRDAKGNKSPVKATETANKFIEKLLHDRPDDTEESPDSRTDGLRQGDTGRRT